MRGLPVRERLCPSPVKRTNSTVRPQPPQQGEELFALVDRAAKVAFGVFDQERRDDLVRGRIGEPSNESASLIGEPGRLQFAFEEPADVGGADLADEVVDRAHRHAGCEAIAAAQ